MVDKDTKVPKLVDWGSADFYEFGKTMGASVGTAAYKAPELLLNYYPYDYAVDMWGVGAIFAGMLFDKRTFFKRRLDKEFDPAEQLSIIIETLGTEDLIAYISKYNLKIPKRFKWLLATIDPPKGWHSLITDSNKKYISEEALDLLS